MRLQGQQTFVTFRLQIDFMKAVTYKMLSTNVSFMVLVSQQMIGNSSWTTSLILGSSALHHVKWKKLLGTFICGIWVKGISNMLYNVDNAGQRLCSEISGSITQWRWLSWGMSARYNLTDWRACVFKLNVCSIWIFVLLQNLFVPTTGFLPLALVGHVDCYNGFPPPIIMGQVYSMFTHEMCPPQGYTSSFQGQFLVSKQRILKHESRLYEHMLVSLASFSIASGAKLWMSLPWSGYTPWQFGNFTMHAILF